MASSCLRLGYAGTPEFAVPTLKRLAQIANLSVVFTQPDRPAGRGQALKQSPVKQCAVEYGLKVLQPLSMKSTDTLEALRALQLDLLIVAAYGQILPRAVLAAPRLGCINIHASLLPRWRGAAPIQRALLAGDAETGITLMRMEAGLDTGPMLAARTTPIRDEDTGQSLNDRLAQMGAELLIETLPSLCAGSAEEIAQPAEGVTYAHKLTKTEALIDWTQDVTAVWRQVRAFNPWPVAETRLAGEQLRLWDAERVRADGTAGEPGRVLATAPHGIDIACGTGVLRVTRLQVAGRKPVTAAEFLRSTKIDGVRLGEP